MKGEISIKMKTKKLLMPILFMLCLTAIAPVFASPTLIYLDPASGEYYPGDEFTVTLKVDAVSDMYLWTVTIEWDPALLDLVGSPAEGKCIKDPDGLCGGPYDTSFIAPTEPGKINEMVCTRLGMVDGANVPPCADDLAMMTFRVKDTVQPCTWIDITITFSDLMDSMGGSIPHQTAPGSFHVIPELAVAILGLGAMFAAFGVYGYRRKNH